MPIKINNQDVRIINGDRRILSVMYGTQVVYGEEQPQIFTFSIQNNKASVTGLTEYGKKVSSISVPPDYRGNPITNILNSTFLNCVNICSITIPSSVTSIGSDAFSGCSGLTRVTVDDGNTTYASHQGILMNKAKTEIISVPKSIKGGIVLPNSVTSIGQYAFSGCSKLTSITIPNSVTSIGCYAFSGCSELTSMTLPFVGYTRGGTTTHFGYIFGASDYNYNSHYVPASLKTVVITGGTSIGKNAFYNCSRLTSVTIGSGVTIIGSSAFSNCTGLTSMTLPFVGNTLGGTTNTHFGYIFGGSKYIPTSLKTIVITGGTSIGKNAFDDCSGLTTIIIPASVTSIGYWIFDSCTSLTSITVDAGNPKYKSDGNCIIETATKTLILGCKTSVIPTDGSVTSIESESFAGCIGLAEVTIPSSVTSIGQYAFRRCDGLTSITLPFVGNTLGGTTNTHFGYIFDDSTYIPTSLKTIVITGGTSIGNLAFSGCSGLTSIIIPASVTSIGGQAFNGCSGLTSITIPNSVTSIGQGAFAYCTELTTIKIPVSVLTMGAQVFSDCTKLTTINCEATAQPAGWDADWNLFCNATVVWGYKGA